MNRRKTLLLAALEALIVVGVGLGVALLCGFLLWSIELGFAGDPLNIWRGAADSWLLGHGVPVTVVLDGPTIGLLGAAPESARFTLSLAPLAFAALTVVAGARSGGRAARGPHPVTAWVTGIAVFAVLGGALGLSASAPGGTGPAILPAVLLPTAWALLGLAIGVGRQWARTGETGSRRLDELLDRVAGLGGRDEARLVTGSAVRAGAVSALVLVGAGAAFFGISVVLRFGTIVGLYEAGGYGLLGGILITLVHFALLPNAIVWSGTWIAGSGFSLGPGPAIVPWLTETGPVPALPVLGAIPAGLPPFAAAVLVIPVAAGVLGALLVMPRVWNTSSSGLRSVAVVVAGQAAVAALIWALLAVVAGGSAGPGNLAAVGPHPGWTALWVFGATLLGGALGAGARRLRRG